MSVDLQSKGAAFKRQLLSEMQEMMLGLLNTLSATVAAQKDGVGVSDQHRVYNFTGSGVSVSDDPTNRRVNINIPGSPTSAATTNYYTTTGSERIFTITTGPYNFPAGWQNPGFNDAAWTTSVDDGTTIATPIDSPLSQWQGTNTLYPTGGEQQAYRHTFTLASGTVTGATLLVWADNFVLEVYVNGTALSGFSTTTDYTATAPVALSVPSGVLTPGGSNVIAVKIRNISPSAANGRMRLNWKLAVAFSGASSGWLSADLASDVSITATATMFDGPNITLAAGTWFVVADITVSASSSVATSTVTTVLWDGTNVVQSGEETANQSWRVQMTLTGFVSITTTTVYRVSAAVDIGTGAVIRSVTVSNGARVRATGIRAFRIA